MAKYKMEDDDVTAKLTARQRDLLEKTKSLFSDRERLGMRELSEALGLPKARLLPEVQKIKRVGLWPYAPARGPLPGQRGGRRSKRAGRGRPGHRPDRAGGLGRMEGSTHGSALVPVHEARGLQERDLAASGIPVLPNERQLALAMHGIGRSLRHIDPTARGAVLQLALGLVQGMDAED